MTSFIGSKRTAALITWLLLLVFSALILAGWWYLLEPTIGHKAVAGAMALAIMFLAALCARQIGQLRADALRGDVPAKWHRGWQPYLFLAVISALGTLNAAFVLFESRAILRGDIANVRNSFGNLRDTAHRVLPNKGHQEKTARVDALLRNLHEEIVNPSGGNYCGVGESAKRIIAAIATELPSYHVLNGPGPLRNCAPKDPRAERIHRAYEDMARRMLADDPDYVRQRGPEKAEFLSELDEHFEGARAELDRLEGTAAGIGATTGLDMDALYLARSKYNSDRRTFMSFSDAKQLPGVDAIDVLQSDRVNSYAATVRLFLSRINHPTSWAYLALAFGLDFAVIFLLTQFNCRFGQRRQASKPTALDATVSNFDDPKFLWVSGNQTVTELDNA